MSFFIVQVQTNHETTIQKTLTELFRRKKVNIVKSIYALDTQTILNESKEVTTTEDIQVFMYQKRLREQLNNMRYAYANIDKTLEPNLKQQYKEQISEISKKVRSNQSFIPKNKTLVTGYVLVELDGDFEKLPSTVYYDIKSVPKVIGIPSTYNIPMEEVNSFFESVREYYVAN